MSGIDSWRSLREACEKYGATSITVPALVAAVRDEAAREAWDEGEKVGERYERTRWQWSAGRVSRAVNGLDQDTPPERPANPHAALRAAPPTDADDAAADVATVALELRVRAEREGEPS